MNKDKKEKIQQQKEQNQYNNSTNSVKVSNQNTNHNVVKEGIAPQNHKD